MNTLLFSPTGIQFDDGGSGDILAIYVPSRSHEQMFSDIPVHNTANIKARYGDVNEMPLWRSYGSQVKVYGNLPQNLTEKRNSVEVLLPQDFAPEDNNLFYYVFDDRWVVHGARGMTDDGQLDWQISRIDAQEEGVVELIANSVSERMMEGVRERAIVAIHGNTKIFDDMVEAMEPFEVDVMRFSGLERDKNAKPLYMHRDYGLLMLTTAMFSFLLLLGMVFYLVVGHLDLKKERQEVAKLREDIRKMQQEKKLGHIKNPKAVLNKMEQPLPMPPSAILHAAGDLAAKFGTLQSLEFDRKDMVVVQNQNRPVRGQKKPVEKTRVVVAAELRGSEDDLLVDQERVARSSAAARPWVRSIERTGNKRSVRLNIGIQVE